MACSFDAPSRWQTFRQRPASSAFARGWGHCPHHLDDIRCCLQWDNDVPRSGCVLLAVTIDDAAHRKLAQRRWTQIQCANRRRGCRHYGCVRVGKHCYSDCGSAVPPDSHSGLVALDAGLASSQVSCHAEALARRPCANHASRVHLSSFHGCTFELVAKKYAIAGQRVWFPPRSRQSRSLPPFVDSAGRLCC